MDAKIKELLTRLSFFAEDGMADKTIVEIAKQADALLLELARKPNTQQPVAWLVERNAFRASPHGQDAEGNDWLEVANEGEAKAFPVFTATPVPRGVLMAFGEAVRDAAKRADFDIGEDVDIAAIADRYAGKVPPEPVNQQLKSVLEAIATVEIFDQVASAVAMQTMARSVLNAIAAAEAAQPVVQTVKVPAGKNRYGLDTPYFVRWLNRVIPSLENYKPAEFAREFGRMAAAANKAALLADQQPASAQPVAVPDAGDSEEWRRLALQFDGHRMQALSHLRCLLDNPESHAEAARAFLAAPPLSGEQVLTERIAAMCQSTDDWQPSGIDYDRSMHSNPDAGAWANFFVETFPALKGKEGLMLGWFANAMMAMHDYLLAQPPAVAVPDGYAQGVEAVAKMLEKKADDFASENGYDDMGSLSFGGNLKGELMRDYHSGLLELAEEIRAMKTDFQQPASAQPVAVPDEITVSMAPHSQYAKGWNACRRAMLSAAQKPEGGK